MGADRIAFVGLTGNVNGRLLRVGDWQEDEEARRREKCLEVFHWVVKLFLPLNLFSSGREPFPMLKRRHEKLSESKFECSCRSRHHERLSFSALFRLLVLP